MIEWLPIDALEQRLQGYPPIGVHLRPFLHGRLLVDPAILLSREPEVIDTDGLGPAMSWGGIVDATPFSIRAQRNRSAWGFELSFPVAIAQGRLDIGLLLRSLAELSLALARCDGPYFDRLPFEGDGVGVANVETTSVVHATDSQHEATAVMDFLNDTRTDRYVLISLEPPPPAWIVAGPVVGHYLSRLEVTSSEATANRLAQQWSSKTGADFAVRRQLDRSGDENS
jgi:hypothetical protein